MKKYSKKSSVAAFYYLALSDGDVSKEEINKFDEIGNSLDPDHFAEYRDSLIDECEAQKDKMIDDEDYADVIIEGFDRSLAASPDEEEIVSPRQLIWDMLVISMADESYLYSERKLIKHLVRITNTDKSVFLEMEHLVRAYIAILKERALLSDSTRPYNEIEPIVSQLDKRAQVILGSAQNLIDDEELLSSIEALEYKPDIFDVVGKGVSNAVSPVVQGVGKAVGGFFGSVFGDKKADKQQETPEEEEE